MRLLILSVLFAFPHFLLADENPSPTAYAAVERTSEGILVSAQLWEFYQTPGGDKNPIKWEESDGQSPEEIARFKVRRLAAGNLSLSSLGPWLNEIVKNFNFSDAPDPDVYPRIRGTQIRREPLFRFTNERQGSIFEDLYEKMPKMHQAALLIRQSLYLYGREKNFTWTDSGLKKILRHLFTDYGLGKYEQMIGHEIVWIDGASISGNRDSLPNRCKEWESAIRKKMGSKVLALETDCGIYDVETQESFRPLIIAVSKGYLKLFQEFIRANLAGYPVRPKGWNSATEEAALQAWHLAVENWKAQALNLLGEKALYISPGDRELENEKFEVKSRYPDPESSELRKLGRSSQSVGTVIVSVTGPDLQIEKGLIRSKVADASGGNLWEGQQNAIRSAEKYFAEACLNFKEQAKKARPARFVFATCEEVGDPESYRVFQTKAVDETNLDSRYFQYRSQGVVYSQLDESSKR